MSCERNACTVTMLAFSASRRGSRMLSTLAQLLGWTNVMLVIELSLAAQLDGQTWTRRCRGEGPTWATLNLSILLLKSNLGDKPDDKSELSELLRTWNLCGNGLPLNCSWIVISNENSCGIYFYYVTVCSGTCVPCGCWLKHGMAQWMCGLQHRCMTRWFLAATRENARVISQILLHSCNTNV